MQSQNWSDLSLFGLWIKGIALHRTRIRSVTDHAALQWLKTMQKPTSSLFWSLKLPMYGMEVRYIRGTDSTEAGDLSGFPIVNLLDMEELGRQEVEIRNGKFTTENGIHIPKKWGLGESIRAHILN